MNSEMLLPIGTSMLTRWMRNLDPEFKLPRDWAPNGAENVKEPVLAAWLPLLSKDISDGNERTCAELDSLRFWVSKNPDIKLARIFLLASDTAAAQWVSQALTSLLPKLLPNIIIEQATIKRLSAQRMHEGLIELIRVAAGIIKKSQQRNARAIINATPGFKAETSLLTLLGALLGAETVYLHEQMQDIIVIPHVQLNWNLDGAQINRLRRLGDAATRDEFRESGIANFPELAPYVERVGNGRDECWGLSPLGMLVVESVSAPEAVSLLPRHNSFVYTCSESEKGHTPADERQTAISIGKDHAFVEVAQRYTWFGNKGGYGVLIPWPEDIAKGIVRVKLPSSDRGGIGFALHTTARSELEWQMARAQLAAAYGRVSLFEELSEGSDELRPVSPGYGEFSDVVTEELLANKWASVCAQNAILQEHVQSLCDQLTASKSEARQHQSAASKNGHLAHERKVQIDCMQKDMDALAQQIVALKATLLETDAETAPPTPKGPA